MSGIERAKIQKDIRFGKLFYNLRENNDKMEREIEYVSHVTDHFQAWW